MAQGKLKVKAKLPGKVKNKHNVNKNKGGGAVTKRANRPVKPKMKKFEEAHKLKQLISKAVNKSVEEEIRARASSNSKTNLSKAQQVVAAYNSAGSSKT